MNFSYDHDKFVAKNRAMADAELINRRDVRKNAADGKGDKGASCFNCKIRQTCSTFKGKRSGGALGVVSFGGEQTFVCERYTPAPIQEKNLTNRQIKSLLKNIKKGY